VTNIAIIANAVRHWNDVNLQSTGEMFMIDEDTPDKMREIVRDTWPGIYMRLKGDDLGLLTREEDGVKVIPECSPGALTGPFLLLWCTWS